VKENHYRGVGSYCGHAAFCDPNPASGPFLLRRLDLATLESEWEFPSEDEWCVNSPAVDSEGNVYANSEDGYLYVLTPAGGLVGRIRIGDAGESAYTPVALDEEGRIYAQKGGQLVIVGE
jgi:outer membrane protein assembly factor BamB